MRNLRSRAQLMLLSAVFVLVGCSGEPKTYHVKGTVMYGDSPLPAGQIFFEPAPGNTGPQGGAPIRNGEYDTSGPRGRAVGDGPYLVRIVGYDGVEVRDSNLGKPLFNNFNAEATLPKANSVQNYDVPVKKKETNSSD